MAHTHSWRRWDEKRFLCTEPSCFRREDLRFYDNKIVKCPTCGEHFILSFRLIKPETELVTCENCGSKAYSPATIEEIHKSLNAVAKETYKPIYSDMELKIEKRLKELDVRETQLNEIQKRLSDQDMALTKEKWNLDKRKEHQDKREERINKRYLQCKEIIAKRRVQKNGQKQEGLAESIEELLKRELSK